MLADYRKLSVKAFALCRDGLDIIVNGIKVIPDRGDTAFPDFR